MNYSRRFAAALIAIVMLLLIWLSAFYQPKNQELVDNNYKIDELKNQLSTLENMSMTIEEFEESVDSLRDVFEREASIVPPKNNFNDRIAQVSDLAAGNRVTVNIINPSANNMITVNRDMQFRNLGFIIEKNAVMLQMTGKYLDIGRYLERINELDGIYVERIEILTDPMVFPELNVFAYLFMYSRMEVST